MAGAEELPDLVGGLLQVGVVHQGAPGLLSRLSPLGGQGTASLTRTLTSGGKLKLYIQRGSLIMVSRFKVFMKYNKFFKRLVKN